MLQTFTPAEGSRLQYVSRDPERLGPLQGSDGEVYLHMRPVAFHYNTAALFATLLDTETYDGFQNSYDWYQVACRSRSFCFL